MRWTDFGRSDQLLAVVVNRALFVYRDYPDGSPEVSEDSIAFVFVRECSIPPIAPPRTQDTPSSASFHPPPTLDKGSLNTLKLHLFSHLREWGVREVRIKATLFLRLSSIPLLFFLVNPHRQRKGNRAPG